MKKWLNRRNAGEILAIELKNLYFEREPYVLAIPKGGVEVGYEIADRLHIPLNIINVAKVRHPNFNEFAIGYVVEDMAPVLGYKPEDLVSFPHGRGLLEESIERAKEKVWQLTEKFRGGEKLPNLSNYSVILVDDGVATGWTIQGAITYLLKTNSVKTFVKSDNSIVADIILVSPVAGVNEYFNFSQKVLHFVCPNVVSKLEAVSEFYCEFDDIPDEEIECYLRHARNWMAKTSDTCLRIRKGENPDCHTCETTESCLILNSLKRKIGEGS